MVVQRGEVYWLRRPEQEFAHPHVVIQVTSVDAVLVCRLTTNLKRAKAPGNVLLEVAEANLPKQSVVVVSQVSTIHRDQFGAYIGTLSPWRMVQVLNGMGFLQKLMAHHQPDEERK